MTTHVTFTLKFGILFKNFNLWHNQKRVSYFIRKGGGCYLFTLSYKLDLKALNPFQLSSIRITKERMDADTTPDWRTLVETFANRNGDINFSSPLLKQTDDSSIPSLQLVSSTDCSYCRAVRTPFRAWRRPSCWDESDNSPSYSFTPSTEILSSFDQSSPTDHLSTELEEPPPPKRYKYSSETFVNSGFLPLDANWGGIRRDELRDLGIAPLAEEFSPRAASTPRSSPRFMFTDVIQHTTSTSNLIIRPMDMEPNRKSPRRRLHFDNEEEEAVYHLVTKYLHVKTSDHEM